jgi:hypothetical protein
LTASSVIHLFNPLGIFQGQYYYEYFPVTDLTYMIEWHFYGKDFPQGFHIDNILLQIINVLLIFFAIRILLETVTEFQEPFTKTKSSLSTYLRKTNPPSPPLLKGGEGGLLMRLRRSSNRIPKQAATQLEMNKQLSIATTAFFTALLFAVSPIMVENVSWLSGRKDLLLMLFYLMWFIFYMKSDSKFLRHLLSGYESTLQKANSSTQASFRKGLSNNHFFSPSLDGRDKREGERGLPNIFTFHSYPTLWSILAFVCFILAILSKFQAVTIPGVLAGYEYFINRRSLKDIIKKLAPYGLVLAVYVPYTMWYYNKGATAFVDNKGFLWTLLFIPEAIVIYIRKFFLPFDLTPVYTVPAFSDTGLLMVSAVFFMLLFVWIIRLFKHKSFLFLFSLSWFFANFVPVSNIISLPTKIADRYMYEAALGVFLIAGIWMTDFYNRINMKRTAAVIYIVIFILLAFLSYRQSLHWKDSYSLWSYTVPLQPDSPVARNNLGVYYKDHGQPQLAKQEYELAITYDNSFVPALWNLGMMYLNQGDYEKAFPLLKRMSEIKAPEQYMACRAVGALYLKFYNNPALAKEYFEMSYRLNPHQPDVDTLKMIIEGL